MSSLPAGGRKEDSCVRGVEICPRDSRVESFCKGIILLVCITVPVDCPKERVCVRNGYHMVRSEGLSYRSQIRQFRSEFGMGVGWDGTGCCGRYQMQLVPVYLLSFADP